MGRPNGRNSLTVDLGPDLERRFTGSGPRAVHTTFRGEVRVRFPSPAGGAAVAGGLKDARLDVLPRSGQASAESVEEGRRTLAFLGLTAEPQPEGPGLLVTEVSPEGRGAAAGVAPGDVLVELGEVTVLGEGDLRVASGTTTTTLVVERASRRLAPATVDVAGLSPRGIGDLGGAAAVLLTACVLLVLPATRFGQVIRWLGLLPGLDPSVGRRWTTARPTSRLGLLAPAAPRAVVLAAASAIAAVLVVVAVAWVSLGHSLFGPDVDLLILPLGASLSLVVARFVFAIAGGSAGRSLSRAARAAFQSAVCATPGLVAVAGAILSSGRFVVSEMVAEQGGAPWRWAGFRSPGLFVLLLMLLAATLPEAARSPHHAGPPARGRPTPGLPPRSFLALAESAHLWLSASLAVVLFLGGGRVPGVTSMVQEESRSLAALGLVILASKILAVVLGVGALRRLTGGLKVEQVAPLALSHGLPLSLLGLVVTALFAAALDGADTPVAADLAGTALALLFFVTPAGLALVLSRRREPATATVNPWL
jgi:NADH:ubiquinone oxidoreductase subunit H